MDKRGINPLIATVLLIGVTIIIAFVIFVFVRGVFDEQMDDTSDTFDIYSQGIQFSSDVTSDGSNTRVLITNEGDGVLYFKIQLDGVVQAGFYEVDEYESSSFVFYQDCDEVTFIPHFFDGEEYIVVSAFTETEVVEEGEFDCVDDLGGECSDTNPCGDDLVGENVGDYGCSPQNCWTCTEQPTECPGFCDEVPSCNQGEFPSPLGDFDDCSYTCYECLPHVTCISLNDIGCSLEPYCTPGYSSFEYSAATDCEGDDSCWSCPQSDDNTALEFDGDADYVSFDDSDDLDIGTGSLSISFWARATEVTGSTELPISNGHGSAGCDGPNRNGYQIRRTASVYDFLICDFDAIGQTKYVRADFGSTSDGVWHHIVSVYDRQEDVMMIYKDGALEESKPVGLESSEVRYPGALTIGGFGSAGSFVGQIDDVRIWNRALTSADIDELRSYAGAQEEGLVARWYFDEGAGDIVSDDVGGHTGTLNGNVVWWDSGEPQ